MAGALTAAILIPITEIIGVPGMLQAVLVMVFGAAAGSLVMQFSRAVQRSDFPSVTRWVSLTLFVIGFHFDLLASWPARVERRAEVRRSPSRASASPAEALSLPGAALLLP